MKNTKDNYIDICHKQMLCLLKYIHKLCEENNIKYTLEAGTMLGAIRDKGFIEWDDDCDISLVREEYDKLKEVLKKADLPDYVGVYYPEEQQNFLDYNLRLYYKSEKIRFDNESIEQYSGIFSHSTLDIYVMDYIPENSLKRRIFVFWQQIMFGLAMSKRVEIKIEKYKPIERIAISILSKIGKIFSMKRICEMHDFVSKKYLSKNVKFLYCTGWIPEFPGWVFDKKSYEKVHLTDFEDTKLYVIDDYETILDGYGDWRTPKKTHDHVTMIADL